MTTDVKDKSQSGSEPVVSVAMITYNHLPYLEEAVEAVMAQRADFEIELLLADDCSLDGAGELVVALGSRHPQRIRVIRSECNVGMHANLLRAERSARGKYVAYCEGDDFWHDPEKLAKQVAFLESRPDYVMVHSNCNRYFVDEKRLLRNSLTVTKNLDDTKAYEDILLGRRLMMTLTAMVRREKLQQVLESSPECTDPKWPMGDTQRWLELSRLGKVGCIHEALATKNMLGESASSSRDMRKLLHFFLAARELSLHYLQKYPVSNEVDRAVRKKLALALLQHAYDARDAATAEKMHSDFVAQNGSPTLRASWLNWGSHSTVRQCLVLPLLKAEARCRWLGRKLRPQVS
jgi:glycosyltransferase involved in cell wall biosynthesis